MKYVNKVYDYKIIRIDIMINKRNWSLTYFFKKVYCEPVAAFR